MVVLLLAKSMSNSSTSRVNLLPVMNLATKSGESRYKRRIQVVIAQSKDIKIEPADG